MTQMLCEKWETCKHTRQHSPGAYCCADQPHDRCKGCAPKPCPWTAEIVKCVEVDGDINRGYDAPNDGGENEP